MRFRGPLLIVGVLLGVAGVVAAVRAAAADPAAADRTAIAEASRAFSAAYVAGDTARIRALYTADAVLLPPGRRIVGGGNAARYFAPHAGRVNVSHAMESARLEIRGYLAVDEGTWHNTWRQGDAAPQSASGAYLVVWRRGDDGVWRIAYDMWHRAAR